MKIRPIGDNILVKRLSRGDEVSTLLYPTETFSSRIAVPDSWRAKPNRGLVIATGRGSLTVKGHLRPPNISKGDIVVFDHRAGSEFKVNNQTFLILRENEILGVE